MFIVERDPKSVASERYKALRTSIQYSSYDKELKVLVVTSTQPQEGKSTTVGNLALSLVQNNKKVLIMDCDLRKPSMHKKFDVTNEYGLTEVLLGRKKFEDVKHTYKPLLDILTTGKTPPNPLEMLSADSMKILIEEVRHEYDYILIDTPPVLAVSDATVLSTIADGVIFVVMASKSKKEQILKAKQELDKVKAPIVGSILNASDEKRGNYGYYYYYGSDESKRSNRNKKKSKKQKQLT